MSSWEGYQYEYWVVQDEGIYDEASMRGILYRLPPTVMEEKIVNILCRAEFLVQRLLPSSAPVETLGIARSGLTVPLNAIHGEYMVNKLSMILSDRLNLPQQDIPGLISQLTDAAVSLFARPDNSDRLWLPLHFNARVTTLQQEGEDLDATLARAITPPPPMAEEPRFIFGPAPPPGEEELFIEALKKQKVRVGQSDDDHHHDECSICLQSLSFGDEISFLPCHHLYHSRCIIPWLRKNFSCPLCRRRPAAAAVPPLGSGRRRRQPRPAAVAIPAATAAAVPAAAATPAPTAAAVPAAAAIPAPTAAAAPAAAAMPAPTAAAVPAATAAAIPAPTAAAVPAAAAAAIPAPTAAAVPAAAAIPAPTAAAVPAATAAAVPPRRRGRWRRRPRPVRAAAAAAVPLPL